MGPRHRSGSLFYNTMLLTAGSLGLRFVQLLFQIYISRIMGAAGLGRMQLILTVGGFGAILASGGVRIAATCLAAEEYGRDNPGGVRTAICCCCIYGLVLSCVVGGVMFLLADKLTLWWIDTPDGALPLRIYGLFLPVTVLWSVLAGYFTAAGRVTELVGLEFFERFVSIGLVVIGIRLELLDPCSMIFLGSSIATLLSFFLLLRRYRKTVSCSPVSDLPAMLLRLLKLTIPLGLNDILRSGLGTIENIIVPKGLQKSSGSGEAAIAAYGTICGMVFPVITFPSVLLYSLSDILVPEMAKSRAKGRRERTVTLTERCLRLTLIYALACGGLGILLGDQLGMLLFGSADAGIYIRVFSPLVVILYLDAITDGILKGLSQQVYTVRYNTITSLMDVGMLFVLLPRYGIGGFLCAFTVSHVVNFFLSIRRLMIETGYLPKFHTTFRGAIACVGAFVLMLRFSAAETIMGTILLGTTFVLIFSVFCYLLRAVTKDDILWIMGLIRRKNH